MVTGCVWCGFWLVILVDFLGFEFLGGVLWCAFSVSDLLAGWAYLVGVVCFVDFLGFLLSGCMMSGLVWFWDLLGFLVVFVSGWWADRGGWWWLFFWCCGVWCWVLGAGGVYG